MCAKKKTIAIKTWKWVPSDLHAEIRLHQSHKSLTHCCSSQKDRMFASSFPFRLSSSFLFQMKAPTCLLHVFLQTSSDRLLDFTTYHASFVSWGQKSCPHTASLHAETLFGQYLQVSLMHGLSHSILLHGSSALHNLTSPLVVSFSGHVLQKVLHLSPFVRVHGDLNVSSWCSLHILTMRFASSSHEDQTGADSKRQDKDLGTAWNSDASQVQTTSHFQDTSFLSHV